MLTRVWRQADPEFAGRLNAIRLGDYAAAAELAALCARPLPQRAGIKPTQASTGCILHRPVQLLARCCLQQVAAWRACSPPALSARPQIFSRNADVDRVNGEELAGLPGPTATCQAEDDVTLQEDRPESRGKRREPLSVEERVRCEGCSGCAGVEWLPHASAH